MLMLLGTVTVSSLRSIILAAFFLISGSARAFSPAIDTLPVGLVTDTVHPASDPTQTYALFIPSKYDASRRWPLLVLMDPRGRALIPLKLFQEAAERYGYIVMSSYQTQSDGPIEPNDKAINAILADAQANYSIDPRRYYFAGFSGTGRLAWYYAYSVPANAAGLIEVGAGLPEPGLLLRERIANDSTAPFAVFLSVGSTDFNYEEVRALDAKLKVFGIRDHLQVFDGGHSWPPEASCTDAISWMQLQAMRDGRLAVDRRWVDSLFSDAARRADDLATVDRYAAFVLYQQLEYDFAGVHDIAGVKLRVDRLAGSESVKRMISRLTYLASTEQTFHQQEDAFFSDFAKKSQQTNDRLRETLNLDALRDRATQTKDTVEAAAAARLLASVFVRASFYEPRRYLALGDTLSALRLYALAQSIHPDDAQLCAERAQLFRVFAEKKSVDRALACESASKTPVPH
jgi:predicted esterase